MTNRRFQINNSHPSTANKHIWHLERSLSASSCLRSWTLTMPFHVHLLQLLHFASKRTTYCSIFCKIRCKNSSIHIIKSNPSTKSLKFIWKNIIYALSWVRNFHSSHQSESVRVQTSGSDSISPSYYPIIFSPTIPPLCVSINRISKLLLILLSGSPWTFLWCILRLLLRIPGIICSTAHNGKIMCLGYNRTINGSMCNANVNASDPITFRSPFDGNNSRRKSRQNALDETD